MSYIQYVNGRNSDWILPRKSCMNIVSLNFSTKIKTYKVLILHKVYKVLILLKQAQNEHPT